MFEKKKLGSLTWHILDVLASRYSSTEFKRYCWDVLIAIPKIYPCMDCRTHLQSVADKYDPSADYAEEVFATAVWGLHDIVNRNLEKQAVAALQTVAPERVNAVIEREDLAPKTSISREFYRDKLSLMARDQFSAYLVWELFEMLMESGIDDALTRTVVLKMISVLYDVDMPVITPLNMNKVIVIKSFLRHVQLGESDGTSNIVWS
jgi:hypothetical protein